MSKKTQARFRLKYTIYTGVTFLSLGLSCTSYCQIHVCMKSLIANPSNSLKPALTKRPFGIGFRELYMRCLIGIGEYTRKL